MSTTNTSHKEKDRLRLRNLVLAGRMSGPARPADQAYFDDLRKRIKQVIKDPRTK